MESTWSRVFDRLTRHGPAWVWRRLRFEWLTPTTAPGRAWLKLRLLARAALRRLSARGRVADDGALHAFYDLQVAPVTFDVLWFIAGAELRRRALGLGRIAVTIVPGDDDGLRREDPAYEAAVGVEKRRQRIDRILRPAFGLLPAVATIDLAPDRAAAASLLRRVRHAYPALYDSALPIMHHPREALDAARRGRHVRALRPSDADSAWIGRWCAANVGGRRLVTITLRQYDYRAARNSDLAAWAQFARSLDPAVYAPCVVPDTAESGKPPAPELAGVLHLPEAAQSVALRLALYRAAFVNLGVNCGPLLLPLFTENARCLMFKMLPADAPADYVRHMRNLGFPPGENPPVLGPGQKWVWEPDSFPVIAREFAALTATIEAGRA